MASSLEIESSLVAALRGDYSIDPRDLVPVNGKIRSSLEVVDPQGLKNLFGEAGEDHVNKMITRAETIRSELKPADEIILAAA